MKFTRLELVLIDRSEGSGPHMQGHVRRVNAAVPDLRQHFVVEVQPRPVVQLTEALREQPMPSLTGAVLGAAVRVVIERVNPRAGLLVLRKR